MPLSRKAVNFDLDTKALQEYYPGSDWHKAYKDIKLFMETNGFEHRQGSGYFSEHPLSLLSVESKTHEMYVKFPWLISCVNKLDVTSIGRTFDLAKSMRKAYDKPIEEPTKARKCSLSALDKNQVRVADQERVAPLDKHHEKER